MTLDEKIEQIRTLIAQRDDIDRQLGTLIGEAVVTPPTKKPKQSKNGNAKWQKLEKGTDGDQPPTGRRSKVSDADKAKVEADLIGGMSVVACFERYGDRLGVSDAWFYLFRASLKKQGKL